MPFTPAPGICEVVHHFGAAGGPQYNIYHVMHTDSSSWSLSQLSSLGTVFKSWNDADAMLYRHSQIFSVEFRLRDLSVQSGTEAVVPDGVSGTAAGSPYPGNVTLAVKASTGHAGRSFRGRTYWVGISESMASGDQIVTAMGNNIVAALTTLLGNVNAVTNQQMCILSGQQDKVLLNPRVGRPIVGWLMADTNLDSQRRRLTGHNIHH